MKINCAQYMQFFFNLKNGRGKYIICVFVLLTLLFAHSVRAQEAEVYMRVNYFRSWFDPWGIFVDNYQYRFTVNISDGVSFCSGRVDGNTDVDIRPEDTEYHNYHSSSYAVPVTFQAWESNDCGEACTYDNNCTIFDNGIGPDWGFSQKTLNWDLSNIQPGIENNFYSNLYNDSNDKWYRLDYTVWWEPRLDITPKDKPRNGGTGYCSGEPIIVSSIPHYLSPDFDAKYVWHITNKNTNETKEIPTTEPVVDIGDTKPGEWKVTLEIEVNGQRVNATKNELSITVHERPPQLDGLDIVITPATCKGYHDGKITIQNMKTSSDVHKFFYNLKLAGEGFQNVLNIMGNDHPSVDPVTFPTDNINGNTSEGLPAGTYELRVENIETLPTDTYDPNVWSNDPDYGNKACYSTNIITISEPLQVEIKIDTTDYNGYAIRCHDSSDGGIDVTSSGGSGSYVYKLNPSTNNPGPYTFNMLKSGNYVVSVTDTRGCKTEPVDNNITLHAPAALKFEGPNGYPAICYGTATGSISAKTIGGVSPYRLDLSGVTNARLENEPKDKTSIFSNLYAGHYRVTATDLNGCVISDTTSVGQPKKIVIARDLITEPLCFGGTDARYEIEATGGLPEAKPAYQYTLAHKNVPKDKLLTFNSVRMQPAKTGLPLISKADFTDLIAGNYVIRIKDIKECEVEYPLYIGSPTKVQAIIVSDSVQCKGDVTGHITTQLIGGTSPYVAKWLSDNDDVLQRYNISGLEIFNLTNRTGGEYKLDIKDAHNCSTDTVSRIGFPQDSLKLSIASLQLQKDSCNDVTPGFVTLEPSGGWSTLGNYQFSTDKISYTPDNFFENLAPGSYKFYVKDGKGCTDSTSVEVPLGTDLQVLIDSTHMVSCYGDNNGFIGLNVFGGLSPYNISIDGGETWQNEIIYPDLPPNDYDVNVQDAGHCLYEITIPVIEPDKLTIDLLAKQLSACNQSSGSISVDVEGGTKPYVLKWFQDTQELTNATNVDLQGIPSGAYRLEVVDKNLCTENIDVDISDDRHPKVDTIITTPVTCYGSSDGVVEIGNIKTSSTIPGYTVIYDYDTTYVYTMNNQLAGEHQLFITDTDGCKLSRKVYIGSPDSLHTTFIEFKDPTCYEGCDAHAKIEAHGGVGGYAYTWQPSPATTVGNNISNACAGKYDFELTDANGCKLAKNVHFKNPTPITANLPGEITICPGKPLVLNAHNAGSTYHWTSDTGFESDKQEVALTNAGNYHLLIKTPEGCTGGDTLQLIVSSAWLEADFIVSSYAAVGDTVVAIEISHPEPSSIAWQVEDDVIRFGSKGPVEEFIFSEEGTYTIALQASLDGCVDRKEHIIQIQSRETVFTNDKPSNLLIKDVTLHPNPNQGHFTVGVTLFKEAPVSVEFMDVGTAHVLQSFSEESNDHYDLEFNVPELTKGVYILRVVAGNEIKIIRCVVY